MDSSISSDDVQWYRLIIDTNTAVMVDVQRDDMIIIPFVDEYSLTTTLHIFNTRQSYTGYYWVRSPYGVFCNVSLTVVPSM